MFADAELYSKHHKMQVIHANNLLDCVLPQMSFGDEDVIMDVGCASGDNTRNTILPRIPKLKKIIAIDVIPEMIEFAKIHMADEKIEYHVADIQDRSSLKLWEGSISKIFSSHVFHWVKNQNKGFESVYSLLKPEGEAVLLFVLSCPAWNSYPALINDVKWNKYLKDAEQSVPESHHLNLRAEHYRKMFEELGFEVLLCQEEEVFYSYKNDTEAKVAWSSLSALLSYVPVELREEFIDVFFEECLKYCPRKEGLPTLYMTRLTVHLRKPS